MRIAFRVILTTIFIFMLVTKTEAQNCTNTLTNGGTENITITSGKTFCLPAGATYNVVGNAGLNVETGGTLYINTNATFTSAGGYKIIGTIINYGTLNLNGYGTQIEQAHIINYGRINVAGISNISGIIENHGIFTFPTINIDGAFTLSNYGTFKAANFGSNSSSATTYVNNMDSLIVTGSGGFEGALDNSGYASFNGLGGYNGLSATVNNYGIFKNNGGITVGAATYFTNDSLAIFSGGSGVNFAGPLLVNNGRFIFNTDFNINNSQMEFLNAGRMIINGNFNFNDAAIATNNCQIYVLKGVSFHKGTFTNYGLIWSGGGFTQNGGTVRNLYPGFVRGNDFLLTSGTLSGNGSLYFTGSRGNTGNISGNDSVSRMLFYTPNGSPITTGVVSNVNWLKTSSISPKDTNSFDCGQAPPAPIIGFPPKTIDTTVLVCPNQNFTFRLAQDGIIKPYDNTYVIKWSSLKLFSVGGSENTTNLNIPGVGTFLVDTTNKNIVFTPVAGFNTGVAKVQYVVADTKSGDPVTYTSPRKTLILQIVSAEVPTSVDIEGY